MLSSLHRRRLLSVIAVIITLIVADWQVCTFHSAAQQRFSAVYKYRISITKGPWYSSGPGFDSADSNSSKRVVPQLDSTASARSSSSITNCSSGNNSAGSRSVVPQLGSTASPKTNDPTVNSQLGVNEGASRSDPAYLERLRDAASKPINIAVMTGLYWPFPTNSTKGCQVDGVPLDCHIQNGGNEEFLIKADALYYHIPSFTGQLRAKAFPSQLRLAVSYENSVYYPKLNDPAFMCQFDAEMTYRACGQVQGWYSVVFGSLEYDQLFETEPVPFEEKLHAIAYINSNCAAKSGRADIMRALMRLGDKLKMPVHSMGKCDTNKPWPAGNPQKIDVLRRYKFCVAMENAIERDYMTEKLWEALAAGCIPIYMGSSTARDTIPDPDSFIMYDASGQSGHASTPEQLDAVMHEIGSDKARYEAMLAWKKRKPEEQPNQMFRHLWSMRHTTQECSLCQFLARHRAEPQPAYTTCLFNKEWLAQNQHLFTSIQQACPQ